MRSLLSIGTSGVVVPAASLPELSLASGAVVIHFNPFGVSIDRPPELMRLGEAGQVLPALLERALAS